MSRSDYPLIERWRRDRAWLTWWGPARTTDELEQDYGPTIDGQIPTIMQMATTDGRDFAMVESYRLADHSDWNTQIEIPDAAGIDYGIGHPDDRGRGLGRALVAALVADTFAEFPECTSVVAAPKTANLASCRTVEAAGFSLVRQAHLSGEWPATGSSSIYRISRTT